jgi:hypothetical protein
MMQADDAPRACDHWEIQWEHVFGCTLWELMHRLPLKNPEGIITDTIYTLSTSRSELVKSKSVNIN